MVVFMRYALVAVALIGAFLLGQFYSNVGQGFVTRAIWGGRTVPNWIYPDWVRNP